MDPERWRRIEELYHSVLEMKPDLRESYLDEACAGDPSLRREVERLIERQSEAEGFIESPALELAAKALAAEGDVAANSGMAGRVLSHYQVLEKIGAGGMGEVFLARDTSLKRNVAIKFLPQEMQSDSIARERFLREARLSHSRSPSHLCCPRDQ